MKGYALYLVLPVVASKKQHIYPAFSFLQPKQRLSQTKKAINGLK